MVYRAMEHRAASDLLKVPVDHAVDRSRIVHLACVLAAVVALRVLPGPLAEKPAGLGGAGALALVERAGAQRVHIEEVSPGDAVVFNDDHQEVSAQVSGLRDGEEVVPWSARPTARSSTIASYDPHRRRDHYA